MAQPPPIQYIPQVTIQHDFPQVINDIKAGLHAVEDIWISCYAHDRPSVHGKARVSDSDETPSGIKLEARHGIDCEMVDLTTLRVSCASLDVPTTKVKFPSASPLNVKGSLESLDVSPDGSRLVVGGKNGLGRVTSFATGLEDVSLRGHASDVSVVKFFPSNEVVLTGSLDMSARVFSALDGSNPRTLKGHTKAVTGLHLIGRGKRVLTSSMDGTVKLWQVSDGQTVMQWTLSQPVTALAVVGGVQDAADDTLDGRLCIVAHSNGTATMFALDTGVIEAKTIFDTGRPSPLHCIAYNAQSALLACGSRSGIITVFKSPRSLSEGSDKVEPVLCFSRSGATVSSLSFGDDHRLLVTTSDGLPYQVSLTDDGAALTGEWQEFAGFEAGDAAAQGIINGDKVYIAGADGANQKTELWFGTDAAVASGLGNELKFKPLLALE
ncbi:hypothetical protein OIO90_003946 [Microbotryomycetes sp. JL221]|nr:hypothetical protein OIO90_003946 [Microbotryomycetes sp. JL221]